MSTHPIEQNLTLSTAPLALEPLHRELLAPRVRALAGSMNNPASRDLWLELGDAIDSLSVPLRLQEQLASLIELALAAGRIRREEGPPAAAALNALYRKTSRGVELAAGLAALNRAFAELEGASIEGVSATMRAPGVYVITLRTPDLQLAIRFDRNGPEIESLEVGLG